VRREVLHRADIGHLGVPRVFGVAFAETTAVAASAVVGAEVGTAVAAAVVAGAVPSRFAEVVSEKCTE
jgi:hypothetical protein